MRALSLVLYMMLSACSAPQGSYFVELPPMAPSVEDWVDSAWVSDVEVTYGVRAGDYFFRLRNAGSNACRGYVTFSDDNIRVVVINADTINTVEVAQQNTEIRDIAMTCSNK